MFTFSGSSAGIHVGKASSAFHDGKLSSKNVCVMMPAPLSPSWNTFDSG
jgi:hypothetical protein